MARFDSKKWKTFEKICFNKEKSFRSLGFGHIKCAKIIKINNKSLKILSQIHVFGLSFHIKMNKNTMKQNEEAF